MALISSNEVENVYFISGKVINEIYIFSLQEQNLNFLFFII